MCTPVIHNPSRTAKLCIALALIGAQPLAAAPMKAFRTWPADVPISDLALKEQYEHDPLAGADDQRRIIKAVSTSWQNGKMYVTSFPPAPSDSQDVPTSPYKSVSMYYGLEGYTTNPQIKILKINFKPSGKWPEGDFTYYAEKRLDPQYLSRKVLSCTYNGQFNATKYLVGLPGKLYKYKCTDSSVLESSGAQPLTTKTVSNYYLSDWLQSIVAIEAVLHESNGEQLQDTGAYRYSMTYVITTPSGAQASVVIDEARRRSLP